MPRGRHRHSPPLHRLLPPSAIAGVSLVCAVGPWLFTEPVVLRALAAGAALTAVVGAVVMRRWDAEAGKSVADLTRARASDEWRHEERVAELEADLDESRALRTKLEHRLRAKRSELAGLRNEHAALLRRYATAETERATALEGRRQLAIEATVPARALPAARSAPESTAPETAPEAVPEEGTPEEGTPEATESLAAEVPGTETAEPAEAPESAADDADAPEAPEVFSPAGSSLFLRANAALSRIASGASEAETTTASAPGEVTSSETEESGSERSGSEESGATAAKGDAPRGASLKAVGSAKGEPAAGGSASHAASAEPPKAGPARGEARPSTDAVAEEGEAQGKPEAVGEHQHATADAKQPVPAQSSPSAQQPRAALPAKPSSGGHFTVPTAVAVAPAAPVRRPSVEGGFDFFGTQKESSADALEAVQNEDLADVVGQEALALHKAEAEAGFKPADEAARGVGQVIDLTAHDETEQIDVGVLRSAVS
ncbi:hypothetical protein BKI49_20145 [Streptomyces sp. Tue6028]|uniref:hypothetical protein n=1 Tax=Streptomyces sp. Tue6028 TaxID=2036037 RepID=UPI000BB30DE2|nr:hypothetical protein [Streptomyces sp. Tue6028]PBC62538.1 hypothetical protein BKI49_20145 [Streptomyces sp. Tue6028]